MEEAFYAERMRNQFGVEVIVPSPESLQLVHEVIYKELCHGVIRQESREQYQRIIRELAQAGAESIILGCTEIELLISQKDSKLPLHASTTIHAHAAVDFALREDTRAMVSQ
jgi:aspartate racemase